ncbi:hypothetical protein Daus18300_001453 [Diaporthe australafricana]|uniref:non-specific serine/threonine protein kinase n=1 Tax=Diaporthe australafricana TaxID=127596 RepID=A0ABR3XVQ6_9PEZI
MEPPSNSQSPASSHLPPPPPPPPPPPAPSENSINLPPAKRPRRDRKLRYRWLRHFDESECEDVQKYVPRGHHPVEIGDKIAEYTVIHKLGFGGFATVWLVQSSGDGQYYALKVLCADASGTKANEQEVMQHLGPHDRPNIVKLLRSFESFGVTGPNGVHTCLVLPVCGSSLYK